MTRWALLAFTTQTLGLALALVVAVLGFGAPGGLGWAAVVLYLLGDTLAPDQGEGP